MHGQGGLLLGGLDGDEPHRWPRHCFTNRCKLERESTVSDSHARQEKTPLPEMGGSGAGESRRLLAGAAGAVSLGATAQPNLCTLRPEVRSKMDQKKVLYGQGIRGLPIESGGQNAGLFYEGWHSRIATNKAAANAQTKISTHRSRVIRGSRPSPIRCRGPRCRSTPAMVLARPGIIELSQGGGGRAGTGLVTEKHAVRGFLESRHSHGRTPQRQPSHIPSRSVVTVDHKSACGP